MKSEGKIYREEANLARNKAESWSHKLFYFLSSSHSVGSVFDSTLDSAPHPPAEVLIPLLVFFPTLPLLGGGVDAIELIGAYLYLSGPVACLKNERFRGGSLPGVCYLLG